MGSKSLGPLFGRVIDIHTHIFDPIPEPSEDALATMVRLARHYGIGRLVMLGNATGMLTGHDPPTDVISDINTLRCMERYPDVFIGFCYLNPANPPGFTEEEIDRCIGGPATFGRPAGPTRWSFTSESPAGSRDKRCLVRGQMRGIKLWTAVKATDDRLDPIMDRARELGVPILHHAWYKQTVQGENESTPAEIAHLARRFPDVTIIMAHLGGGRERGVLDIVDVPNVLVDTSGSQSEAGLVEYGVRRLGAQRVVYGSDWPIRDFGTQVARVRGAELTAEQRELILHRNAARVLGLGADFARRRASSARRREDGQ